MKGSVHTDYKVNTYARFLAFWNKNSNYHLTNLSHLKVNHFTVELECKKVMSSDVAFLACRN